MSYVKHESQEAVLKKIAEEINDRIWSWKSGDGEWVAVLESRNKFRGLVKCRAVEMGATAEEAMEVADMGWAYEDEVVADVDGFIRSGLGLLRTGEV